MRRLSLSLSDMVQATAGGRQWPRSSEPQVSPHTILRLIPLRGAEFPSAFGISSGSSYAASRENSEQRILDDLS
jgi:hypothetical protein